MKQSEFAKEYKKVFQGKISSMDLQRQLESKYGMKKPTYFKYVKEFKKIERFPSLSIRKRKQRIFVRLI